MKPLLTSLRESGRFRLYSALALSIVFSLGLVAFRMLHSGKITYVFYVWNLFLAVLPFAASTLVAWFGRSLKSPLSWALLAAWLLFLPNAPYLVTDLIHLRPRAGIPMWYDTLLTLSFAWNGLVLCFLSVGEVQEMVAERFSAKAGWFTVVLVMILCGFGVYLGRYLRWNSWDLVHAPLALLDDILERVLHPMQHKETWGVTFGYAIFLSVGYYFFHSLSATRSWAKRPEMTLDS